MMAKLIHQVTPPYPPLARQTGISGTVVLQAIIGRDGCIRDLQVLSGHPLLIPAAVDAVRQWLYQPTTLNGSPVEVLTTVEVRFVLSR
jgi:protein TonB